MTSPVSPVDWTGFYIGGLVGYGWGDKDVADAEEPDETGSYNVDGWLGGIEAGANWQSGRYVFGVEGDIAWTDINGGGLIDGDDPISTQIDFLATLTGRVGVAWQRALFYVEGGGAWVNEDHTLIGDINNPPGVSDTISDNRFGGLLGVGVEYALRGNWSLKAEYNYLWFGSEQHAFEVDEPDFINIDQDLQTFKVGINFRF